MGRWTLQELIAPVLVEFFSREGRRIGDAPLDQLIHDITDFPFSALRNRPLNDFTTSEPRRWAEIRRTKEEEDIVYCLLGVLGISMHTAHGEGQESARRRPQTELDAAGSAPSIIPFSRNESFVGLESQLADLEAKLFSNDQTTTTLAIVRPGGTGKLQLAFEVAHGIRLNIKDRSVFWMDVSDTSSLYRSYASVTQKLSIPGCNAGEADKKQFIKRCVAEKSWRQCLLIFDNVADTNVWLSGSSSASEAALLADFLLDCRLSSAIFTITESDMAEVSAPENVNAARANARPSAEDAIKKPCTY